MLEVDVFDEAPPGSGAPSVEVEHEESYRGCLWGDFTPTLENKTMLPLFGKANAIGIILEEHDQTKLKYLTVAMASWKKYT